MQEHMTTPLLLVAAVSLVVGLIFYTAKYANGFSYISSDPNVCINCHIMQPQFDAWSKSSHHAVATCVDCHLPHDFVGKYLAKVRNGYFHSKAFTLQNFPEPIRITPENSKILEANCRLCHQATVEPLLAGRSRGHAGALSCVHGHAGVGHGETASLGKAYPQTSLKL